MSLGAFHTQLSASQVAFNVVQSERDQFRMLLDVDSRKRQNLEAIFGEVRSSVKDHSLVLCSFQKMFRFSIDQSTSIRHKTNICASSLTVCVNVRVNFAVWHPVKLKAWGTLRRSASSIVLSLDQQLSSPAELGTQGQLHPIRSLLYVHSRRIFVTWRVFL